VQYASSLPGCFCFTGQFQGSFPQLFSPLAGVGLMLGKKFYGIIFLTYKNVIELFWSSGERRYILKYLRYTLDQPGLAPIKVDILVQMVALA